MEEFVFFFFSYLSLLLLLFCFVYYFFLFFINFLSLLASFPFFLSLVVAPSSQSSAIYVACAAGGTWVGVLYCFGGGAAKRNPPRRLRHSLRVAAPSPRKYPGHKNPASYAGYHLRISSYLKILAFNFALIFFVLIFCCVQIIEFSDNFHIYRNFKVLSTKN